MIPVEGHKSLFRDEETNAIVNTDTIAYDNYMNNLKMMKTGYQRLSGSIGIRTPGPRDATKIGQVGRTSNYEDYLRAWNSRMRKFAVQRYYASLGKK